MQAFVNAHVNAGKEGGREVAAKYGVRAFPTLVIVDERGGEIDRIIGYRTPETFIPEIQRILRGEGTLPALRRQAEASPDDLACVVAYAEKLIDSDAPAATKRLSEITERLVSEDAELEARKWLVLGKALQADRSEGLRQSPLAIFTRVATDFAGTKAASDAVRRGASLAYRLEPEQAQAWFETVRKAATTDKDRALVDGMTYTLHMQLAARALKAQGDAAAADGDAQALNQVAWTFYEHRTDAPFRRYLSDALAWARQAVELSRRDAAILDTYACLLSVTGRLDEAIAIEEEALGKVENDAMKADFEKNVAEWKKRLEELKARNAVPATPLR
jgi:tetratricopeptide (TPR) repeat protein